MKRIAFLLYFIFFIAIACGQSTPAPTPVNRYSLLPDEKLIPEADFWPPIIIAGWTQPEPLPYPVNTAGGEDSPFILPNDQTLYFFFTPDISLPAEKQLLDGVTGIWVTHRSGKTWNEPQRVRLSESGRLALDGCVFVLADLMYFCTIREG